VSSKKSTKRSRCIDPRSKIHLYLCMGNLPYGERVGADYARQMVADTMWFECGAQHACDSAYSKPPHVYHPEPPMAGEFRKTPPNAQGAVR
jgi:hypothetical protein